MSTFLYIVMQLIISAAAAFIAISLEENGYGFLAGVLFGAMFAVAISMVNILYFGSKLISRK